MGRRIKAVRAKQDYWNQGTDIFLAVKTTYDTSVKITGDNLYAATSVKDTLNQ